MTVTINASTSTGLVQTADLSGALAFQTNSGTTAMTIDTSQNVGIGSTTALTTKGKLGVYATGDQTEEGTAAATIGSWDTSGMRLYFGVNNTNQYTYIGSVQSGTAYKNLVLQPNGGYLLVGVTSPSGGYNTIAATGSNWALVAKNLSTSGSVYGFKSLLSYAPNNTSSYFIGCEDNSTGRMYVYSNGNVVNTNNSYGAISDITLKENIVDASPKLENLCKVKIRNFNLIGETTKQLGVVAQELEEIFPSMVEVDGNTQKKQVKYSVFVPMLVKAIQELKAINDTQAETINALTARIVALESK